MKPIPLFENEQSLPQRIGLLHYREVIHFDDKRLGVQVRYASPDGVKADVYLYDLGMTGIPSDIMSPIVQEFFKEACGDVFTAAKRGMLLDLEVKTSQYLYLPSGAPIPMYLWATFYYRQAPGPSTNYEGMRYSHLALRTDKGYINKVRYTYPDIGDENASLGLIAFLMDWHNVVQHI
jgi:hypothetical protein